MANFKIINPIDYGNWDTMISAFPEANSFHTVGWLRTLLETYKYSPLYATWWDGEQLVGVFPMMEVKSVLTGKRGVSLPFTDFCTFLFEFPFNRQEKIDLLLDIGKSRGWAYLETRESTKNDIENNSYSGLSYYEHNLDLTLGLESIHRNMRDSSRRNIRKAERQGVRVFEENTLRGVSEFFRLNVIRRKVHGLPPQPKQFFENLFRNVIAPGNGKIFLADYHGKIIASIICLSFNGQVIFKYGGSDMRYHELRANNLLMWEAISTYCDDENWNFSFGKTEIDHTGLRQYKWGWGTTESGIRYMKYDIRSGECRVESFSKEKFYNSAFSRMPLSLLKLSGRFFYRHVG